jgi:hypothetical protein
MGIPTPEGFSKRWERLWEATRHVPVLTLPQQVLDYALTADHMLSPDELETLLGRIGRERTPELLYDLFGGGLLTPLAAARCVADAWSGPDSPERSLSRDQWLELFRHAGYTQEGSVAPRPPSPVQLYRGASLGRRGGMSWTSDIEVARLFARMPHVPPDERCVFRARVTPRRLLGYIHFEGRQEAEFIVDPRRMPTHLYEVLPPGA